MKHSIIISLLASILVFTASCGGNSSDSSANDSDSTAMAHDTVNSHAILTHPEQQYDSASSFIVISKKDLTLTVYARSGNDTVALASYPCCMGKNKGDKIKSGDMRTPESPDGKPFTITMIQDASQWSHDFGDGRGSILAYGNWFLRLKTPHNGIGIHGSTNNENTVPGRASEGCIRLLDKDIILLKEKYARVGMPVIVKGEEQGLLPFEVKCLRQQ